jgi:hypothetical protein
MSDSFQTQNTKSVYSVYTSCQALRKYIGGKTFRSTAAVDSVSTLVYSGPPRNRGRRLRAPLTLRAGAPQATS